MPRIEQSVVLNVEFDYVNFRIGIFIFLEGLIIIQILNTFHWRFKLSRSDLIKLFIDTELVGNLVNRRKQ